MPEIASLRVGDPPDLWSDLGFAVADQATWVSGIQMNLGGDQPGISAWQLRNGLAPDGLPVASGEPPEVLSTPGHPNGVATLDHLVVMTPDLGRTMDALETAGIALRRTRDAGGREPMTQAFFKLGEVVLEVVGPTRTAGSGPARFWGLTFVVADLDATTSYLGDRLRPAIDAVQPGRRIATLDRSAGSSVPMAFMTPRPARAGDP